MVTDSLPFAGVTSTSYNGHKVVDSLRHMLLGYQEAGDRKGHVDALVLVRPFWLIIQLTGHPVQLLSDQDN